MLRSSLLLSSGVLVASLAIASGAAAQEDLDDEQDAATSDEGAESAGGGSWSESPSRPEVARDDNDPREERNTDYYFVGAFYRHVIIPGFIQQLFVAGGIDGSNPGVGATFNWRRNDFNVVANFWWNNAEGSGYFRALGDPRTDTEFIQSRLGVIFLNAEFLWSFPITDWFAFELGFDLGVGFVYGNIVRTEAYESSPGADDWQPCTNPGQPSGTYCEGPRLPPETCFNTSGGHYDCAEPNWTTPGGDVPVIVPWITLPHLALRFKPIRQLQIRVDFGYGIYNFFFGGSASYGF